MNGGAADEPTRDSKPPRLALIVVGEPMRPPLHRMFTCEAVAERLSDYIDGELAPVSVRILELHLAGCPACSRFARELMQMVRALRGLGATRRRS